MAEEGRNRHAEALTKPNKDEAKVTLTSELPNICESDLLNICTVLLHSALDLERVFPFFFFLVEVEAFIWIFTCAYIK